MFYGWWIVIASIPMSIFTGAFFYGFSALFDPIIEEFGWSRALTSVAFALQQGESGIAAPIVGVLVDKMGPRRIVIVGGVIYGVGFLLLGYIDGLWMFYMMFLVISVGSSGCNPIVTYIAAAQWFRRKRGRSMGIISLGSAFSGIMVYLLVVLISQFGWRTTVQVLGIASWAVILPLALVFRHRPEQYGLLPDGDVAGTNSPVYSKRTEVDFRFKEAVSTRTFWYLGAVFTLCTLVHGAVISQLISALKLDGNVSLTVAGAAAAGVPLFSVIGRLGMGSLSDFVDKKTVVVASLAIQAIGLLLLANLATPLLAIGGAFFYGVGSGGVIPVRSALQADLFGARNFGTIQGGLRLLSTAGGVAGPIMAGGIADAQDSYRLFYYICVGALVATAVFVMMLRQPRVPGSRG